MPTTSKPDEDVDEKRAIAQRRDPPQAPFVTEPLALGACIVDQIDDVASLLALEASETFGLSKLQG